MPPCKSSKLNWAERVEQNTLFCMSVVFTNEMSFIAFNLIHVLISFIKTNTQAVRKQNKLWKVTDNCTHARTHEKGVLWRVGGVTNRVQYRLKHSNGLCVCEIFVSFILSDMYFPLVFFNHTKRVCVCVSCPAVICLCLMCMCVFRVCEGKHSLLCFANVLNVLNCVFKCVFILEIWLGNCLLPNLHWGDW